MSLSVNGEVIPESAVQFELDRLVRFYSDHMPPEEIRAQLPALRARARRQAVGAKLLIMEAERLDLVVPEADITRRFQALVQQSGGPEGFQRLLQKQGLSEGQVRQSIERGRRVDLLIAKIGGDVPEPTEQQIQAHFLEHREEYRRPERANASHILVRVEKDAPAADRAAARQRTEAILERLRDGADFAAEAAAHSDCPSGKQAGGSLGWFGRGMMVPEFDRAVFSMAVGALSEIIESPFGFHIIHKAGQEAGGAAEFDDVRERVRDFLRHAWRGAAIAEYVEELRAKADVKGDEDASAAEGPA